MENIKYDDIKMLRRDLELTGLSDKQVNIIIQYVESLVRTIVYRVKSDNK